MLRMGTRIVLQIISCAYLVVVCRAASNCNELQQAANGTLPSGPFTVTNGNGQAFTIYCQFYSGYGYAFVSSNTDVDVDMTSLYDDASHVVIRHKRRNGLQYTSTMEQLFSHSSTPLLIAYNNYTGYKEPINSAMTPYIYVGFIPASMTSHGARQGWKCNGQEHVFLNCDANPNSYIVFLFDHDNVTYTNRVGEYNSLVFCWYDDASAVTSDEDLPDEFFTPFFEVHHGGCGGYATSGALVDITGATVGVKFDIDECAAGTDNCDVNAHCTNTAGSFTCSCNAGYNGDGVTCTDIDECAAGTDNCDVNAHCANTAGSFTCSCNAGYNGDGVTCTDINECTDGTDNCDANAHCTNNAGSFTCVCITGYNGNGVTCADVDECTTGEDNCDANATCTNTDGSYTCACNPGYTGSGITCTDINECASNPCQNGATCNNLQNSYTCTCAGGWTGTDCEQDVDECASSPCQNGGQCTNGQNMFTCTCSSGWIGTTCQIGFVCNPDNSIDVSNLPANFSFFAMQNVTSGPDVECNVTATGSTSIQISACSKDLDIILTYSTYNEMSTYQLHGGKSLTAVVVKCGEISENGTVHNVNNTFEANLLISSDTDIAPTYSVDSYLSTNSTTVGSDVTWTIRLPEEYILEVTSCTAYPGTDDSSSNSVSLISDGGCTVTDELISNFTDHGNGSVSATLLAFKFYDNDYVFLQCDLKVCPNKSSACDTQCSRMKRSVYKRNVHDMAVGDETNNYYTNKVNTLLRVVELEMLGGAMKVSAVNLYTIFAFSILPLMFVTEM